MKEIEEIQKKIDKLTKEEAKDRLYNLYSLVSYHSNLYYNMDKPKISDFEYDMLSQEIRKIENRFPELKKEDADINKVGGKPSTLFNKVNLEVKMQSLMDVFEISEVKAWMDKIEKEYGKQEYVVETKIDGLSSSLTYENGKLILASTRGDGIVGEDITENIEMVESIPKKIKYDGKIILRGEIYISKEDFKNIVEKQEENGEKTFANPRNAAAGSLRQKDKNIIKDRKLNIFVFNVQYSDKKFKSHFDSLNFVKSIGVDINKFVKKIEKEDAFENVKKAIEEIHNLRSKLKFEIDGAVIKIDDLDIRKKMGETAKTPRWAIAYKYPAEQKETVVKDILINVGRTGALTPVAILKPVFVDGSSISKASLHNFEYLKEKDIKIGDKVLIQKAGDIIPEVVRVLKDERTGLEIEFKKPKICPVCGEEVYEDKISIFCKNPECPSKIQRKIEHFASRDAMNIEGFAEKNIATLLEKELIKNIVDIYKLTEEDFLGLKKNGKKFAKNMYESIQKSKNNPLHKLINGIGIPNIGITTAKKLAKKYKNINNLMNASKEELLEIEDIGEIVSEEIVKFFQDEKNREDIKKLIDLGVNVDEPEENILNILEEKTFVITGKFEKSRKDIEKMIEENGGKVSSSVSTKTDYLIAGEKAGSKLDKAKELDIEIISLEEFEKILKNK